MQGYSCSPAPAGSPEPLKVDDLRREIRENLHKENVVLSAIINNK